MPKGLYCLDQALQLCLLAVPIASKHHSKWAPHGALSLCVTGGARVQQ